MLTINEKTFFPLVDKETNNNNYKNTPKKPLPKI